MYNVFDYPIRLFAGEHNEGSHGSYPYPGEWESAAGLGSPESVQQADKDSTRVVPHDRFRTVLTPEPGRIDYSRNPETGLALDVGLRYYRAGTLPTRAQADGADLQFLHLWIGHLLRF